MLTDLSEPPLSHNGTAQQFLLSSSEFCFNFYCDATEEPWGQNCPQSFTSVVMSLFQRVWVIICMGTLPLQLQYFKIPSFLKIVKEQEKVKGEQQVVHLLR